MIAVCILSGAAPPRAVCVCVGPLLQCPAKRTLLISALFHPLSFTPWRHWRCHPGCFLDGALTLIIPPYSPDTCPHNTASDDITEIAILSISMCNKKKLTGIVTWKWMGCCSACYWKIHINKHTHTKSVIYTLSSLLSSIEHKMRGLAKMSRLSKQHHNSS